MASSGSGNSKVYEQYIKQQTAAQKRAQQEAQQRAQQEAQQRAQRAAQQRAQQEAQQQERARQMARQREQQAQQAQSVPRTTTQATAQPKPTAPAPQSATPASATQQWQSSYTSRDITDAYRNKLQEQMANIAPAAEYNYVPTEYVAPEQMTTAQDAYANRGTAYLDIAKAYEDKTRANLAMQEEAMARQLATSKAATAANYDSAAAANYIDYAKQQNAIGEQLARQGIRGGASESALARIGNNYALNQGNTTAQRYAAYGALQNTYDTNLANMRQSAEESIMNNNLALQQSQLQYDDTLAQRAAEEARYNAETARAAMERWEDVNREAKYRYEDISRSDRQRAENMAREDARYEAEVERAIRERQDEILREDYLRNLGWEREDLLASNANTREDYLRDLDWWREDQLTAAANAREDSRYREEVERAVRERNEDIAREERYRTEDRETAAQQYADEQAWKEKEWTRYSREKKVEEFAAGLTRYTGNAGITDLKKLRDSIKKDKKWASNPYKYGQVQAINARIGGIKAEMKK